MLSEETDPNKLNDQKRDLDAAQVYTPEQVEQFVALFLAGAERDKLDPILDACVTVYNDTLDEDQQVDFKGKAKAFCRTYDFLASITPGTNVRWEKLSILLNLLVAKLPAPKEEDLAKGIIDAIDMDNYRVDKQVAMKVLADTDAAIDPSSGDGGGFKSQPELDKLSSILKAFNDSFGTLFTDSDRVVKKIREEVAQSQDNVHTKRSSLNTTDDQTALGMAMQILLKDDTQIYKQFVENDSFKRFVGDMVYALTSCSLGCNNEG